MQPLRELLAVAFPAYAGMNRPTDARPTSASSVPRVCGDEPKNSQLRERVGGRSPRMRG